MNLLVILLSLIAFSSCTKTVNSQSQYIFKSPPDTTTAAKNKAFTISHEELNKGIAAELFEAEMKVYEIKFNKLKAMVLEKIVMNDPKKKDLSTDEFLEKFIIKNVSVSNADIEKFIKEKNIPKEHQNDLIKERIKEFLLVEGKKEAVEKWMNKELSKAPVEVYLQKPNRPTFNVAIGNSPVLGKETAPVTIVEFSDFQCPYCKKGSELMKEIKNKYKEKVKIVFKQFPLSFHPLAAKAAEASLCAKEQSDDFFWKYHDALFNAQDKLEVAGLKATAKSLGLKSEAFDTCLDSSKYAGKVQEEIAEGGQYEVKSTPTYFVNGQLVSGAQPLEVFSELIETSLKQ